MNFEDPFANDLRNFSSTVNAVRRSPDSGGGSASLAAGVTGSAGGIIDFDIGGPGGGGGGRRRRLGETPAVPAVAAASPLDQGMRTMLSAPPPAGRRQQQQQQAPLTQPPPQQALQQNTLVVEDDDPLAFLEARVPTGQPSAVSGHGDGSPQITGVAAVATLSPAAAAAAAEAARQTQEIRELYAQLYALDEENTKAEEKLKLQEVKEEAELLTLATAAIEKTLALEHQEGELQAQCDRVRKSTEERVAGMEKRYAEELAEQDAEVRRLEGDRYGRQLKQLTNGLLEVEKTLVNLRQQKQLILDTDPLSTQGLLLTLSTDPTQKSTSQKKELHTSKLHARSAKMDGDSFRKRRGSGEGKKEGADSDDHSSVKSSNNSPDDYDEDFESTTEEDTLHDPLERTLMRGVDIIRQYCDRHVNGIKDHVIDYIHSETLAVAHDTRTQSLLAWAADAADRKEQLGEHITGMLQRYRDLSQTRAVQRQTSLRLVHEELAATSRRLRQDAADRVQRLTSEVTAKLKATTGQFERVAHDHVSHLQKKIGQTIAGDLAMSQAQQEAAAQRYETEDRVRRQLREAAMGSLHDQLAKLQARNSTESDAAFAKARESATSQTTGLCEPLRDRANDMRRLIDVLAEEERKAQQQRRRRGWSSYATMGSAVGAEGDGATAERAALVMANHERASSLEVLQATVRRTQDELFSHRDCLRDTYDQLCTCLQDHVHALREKRLAQQSHQSAINFTRTAWERDHQRNLTMGLHLEVPVLFAGDDERGTLCPSIVSMQTETHTAPGDAALVALLEFIGGALAGRTARSRELQARRRGVRAAQNDEWTSLSRQIDVLRKQWTDLLQVITETEQAKDVLAMQQLAIHKEMAENHVQRDDIVRQRAEIEQRQAALDAKSDAYEKESEAVMAAYDAARLKLEALSSDQLHLAMQDQDVKVAALAAATVTTRRLPEESNHFLRDCTNVNHSARPSRATAKKEESPHTDHSGCNSNSSNNNNSCTPPRQVAQGRNRYPPLSPSKTPPELTKAPRNFNTSLTAVHDGRQRQRHASTSRLDRCTDRSPFSSTSTSAPDQRRTATGTGGGGGGRGGGPSSYTLPGSGSSHASTAPAGNHDSDNDSDNASPNEKAASPYLNASTVSVSSLHRSSTFVDLVTILDSTTASGAETL